MTLADLIDLEAQLAADVSAGPDALEARDRGVLAGDAALLGRQGRGRTGAILEAWLARLREADPARPRPGRTVAAVLGGVRAVLVLGGLALGWAAATAVLRYAGDAPVNVWDFLLAFVGIQVLLFVLLLASFLFPVAALGLPMFGLFRGVIASVYPRVAARLLRGDAARLAEWRAFWQRLRSRRSLYHRLEPWVLLGLTQAFGVAFNVGALAGCLRLVVFSDLAFSWSTTLLHLDAARFHAAVSVLAWPFGWLWPDAAPTRELVEATRYSRLEAAYVASGAHRSAHPELVGGWWPFLLACLACYGLLPRLLTATVAAIRARRVLARLPFDDAEVQRLVRRLTEPHVDTRSPTPDAGEPLQTSLLLHAPEQPPDGGRSCGLVLWRDVPPGPGLERAVALRARRPVAVARAAGGRDYDEGGTDWGRVLDGADPVVVVAEAWEAPDKAALRLLRNLRASLGPARHLVVMLVADGGDDEPRAPRPVQLKVWREGVAELEDPYLAVEPLAGTP